jgi:hypothetical protein
MDSSKLHTRPRRKLRRPQHDQNFSSYLAFGLKTTVVLGVFLGIYALVLLCLSPLLSTSTTSNGSGSSSGNSYPSKRGEALRPAFDPLLEKVKNIHLNPIVPGQILAEGIARDVKRRVANFRKKEGFSDASLIDKANAEINHLRQQRSDLAVVAKPDPEYEADTTDLTHAKTGSGEPSGFVVLGMHRSGTSMLAGLLVTGMGYKTGGPLIGSASDNEKGFFELLPVVLQNDELMKAQRTYWDSNVWAYKGERGLEDKKSGKVKFHKGDKALEFLNNPDNGPWLQKDPRMCITLKTWIPLFDNEPAALFTYRHPLEVALSLKKRESGFPLERGLNLWINYNMRSIQNSAGLCRVISSNEAVLADPFTEVQRISDELTTKCGVPKPPRKLEQIDVDKFVDPDLQHNKKKREEEGAGKPVLADYDGCVVREYESSEAEGSDSLTREHEIYLQAMKIYCDLQSGAAYKDDYDWPKPPA